jgi:hypothetical protein
MTLSTATKLMINGSAAARTHHRIGHVGAYERTRAYTRVIRRACTNTRARRALYGHGQNAELQHGHEVICDRPMLASCRFSAVRRCLTSGVRCGEAARRDAVGSVGAVWRGGRAGSVEPDPTTLRSQQTQR